jgi:predicted glycoside hydrolase/deacetylase ChbG (UPF0249 family)
MNAPAEKLLIVNADDFGLSAGVNRGIIRAHEHGVVTSASLMVRQPAAAEAAAYAKTTPSLGLGLHLDLGEWVYRGGRWAAAYEVVSLKDPAAVAAELGRQLGAFRKLTGRDPDHFDSHQHVHRDEPVRSIAVELAARVGVPLRHFHGQVRYRGDFYGQTGKGEPLAEAIGAAALARVVRSLAPGVTELACHPGDDAALDSPYRAERVREVEALCDPEVRAALTDAGVRLITFAGI